MSIAEETAAIVEKLPASMAQSVLDCGTRGSRVGKATIDSSSPPEVSSVNEDARREVAAGKSVPMDMDRL